MVVFTCGDCGEALKKNQVEKHCNSRCRNCNVLSCIDCGKEFWGNDYQQHVKCISEEEKYSGKNYVPKANANKGEVKQNAWVQKVQDAIDKANTNRNLQSLLERLKDYPNIPRKRAKFENFLRNSLRIHNPGLIGSIWDMLLANTEPSKTQESQSPQSNGTTQVPSQSEPTTESQTANENADNNQTSQSEATSQNQQLSKRERKEERRKEKHRKEKKDKHRADSTTVCDENGTKPHKKKKRKHQEMEENGACSDEHSAEPAVNGSLISEADQEDEDEEPKRKRICNTKFDWEEVITDVLKSKGSEMKIKRVRKKVLAEYLAQGCTAKSEERLWAKFDKKLKKNPKFKVLKENVKLSGR